MKAREWTIYDADEYGPAWDGPRFEPIESGIKVREVREGDVCITREELRAAIRHYTAAWGIDEIEKELFGAVS